VGRTESCAATSASRYSCVHLRFGMKVASTNTLCSLPDSSLLIVYWGSAMVPLLFATWALVHVESFVPSSALLNPTSYVAVGLCGPALVYRGTCCARIALRSRSVRAVGTMMKENRGGNSAGAREDDSFGLHERHVFHNLPEEADLEASRAVRHATRIFKRDV